MSADLSLEPWPRLTRLAPPGTPTSELQIAADRWAVTADVYGAAADLWEEKLLSIDLGPDDNPSFDPADPLASGRVSSMSQDGLSVSFAQSTQDGNTQNARRSQAIQIRAIVRGLRAKQKPYSPVAHSKDYNPWKNTPMPQDDAENIIVVDEV